MKAQCLAGNSIKNEIDLICRNSGGIQAQVISSGIHSLWVRHQKLNNKNILKEINNKRSIVKTYAMRGTIHLIPSTDYSIYIQSLKENRLKSSYQTLAQFGIGGKEIDRYNNLVLEALDNTSMTKKELWNKIKPALNKKFLSWRDQIWNVFKHSMEAGIICYGEMNGGEVKLVRTDQWLPNLREIGKGNAQKELMRIFLAAFGPAGPRDFARWSGLNVGEATGIIDEIKDELAEIQWGNDQRGFLLKSRIEDFQKEITKDYCNLLPNFDTYLLGHKDKTQYVDPGKIKKVYRQAGWISPVILFNGTVIGTWNLEKKGSYQVMRMQKFEKFNPQIKGFVKKEALKLSRFLGEEIKVRYS